MAFSKLTLSAALAGHEITSFSQAWNFLNRLDVSKQTLPHWQKVRQGLLIVKRSEGSGNLAWREFRKACRLKVGLHLNRATVPLQSILV
jgi:hypothetical protein